MINTLFKSAIYQPILVALVFIYQNLTFGDLGLAIIVLTILMRIVLFPIFYKSAKDQALMQRLQPHIKKIQLDHKENKEAQAKALLGLYKKYRFNPFSGFFLLFLQLPIFFALFKIFSNTTLLTETFDRHSLLGLISLESRSFLLVFVAALFQYWQSRLVLIGQPQNKNQGLPTFLPSGQTMALIGPLFTVMILVNLPAALGLYWAISNLFSVFQQIIINKNLPILKHGDDNTEN